MNTIKLAEAMVARADKTRRNVTTEDILNVFGAFRYEPMVAPQKDGLFALVRRFRGDDELVTDLSADEATQRLSVWLGEMIIMPLIKAERIEAALAQLGML